jgi:proline iminopeptidase
VTDTDTTADPTWPVDDGVLEVGDGHRVYWRSHGNPTGPVVAILHGGPGAGHNPRAAQFFDPAVWRVVMFDQRGCGRSTPTAATEQNTTAHLVTDMERLREALGIERWALFGGSWGTRLAISYGIAHPERCTGFMLRAVFLARPRDISWFLWDARRLFPDTHAAFLDAIEVAAGERPRDMDTLLALTAPVLRDGHPQRAALVVAWDEYETRMSSVAAMPAPTEPNAGAVPSHHALTLTTLEHHYMLHVLPNEADVLDTIGRIAHLPCEIVHGRYDIVCPFEQAWQLAAAWPAATLTIAAVSGHWTFAPEMSALLQDASGRLLRRIQAG